MLQPINEQPLSAKKNTAVLHHRRKNTDILWFYRFRQSLYRRTKEKPPTANKLPHYCIPPETHRLIWFYRFRQKRENRQPRKNYSHMALSRPLACVRLKYRYRRP